ncbi:hypothetical protein [Streptococcus porcinus]
MKKIILASLAMLMMGTTVLGTVEAHQRKQTNSNLSISKKSRNLKEAKYKAEVKIWNLLKLYGNCMSNEADNYINSIKRSGSEDEVKQLLKQFEENIKKNYFGE